MDEYQLEFANGLGESYQNCPACGKEMIPEHDECFACGVVIGHYQERLKLSTTRNEVGGIDHLENHELKTLDKKWRQVVLNYNDSAQHMSFIQHCHEIKALPFAVHQYTQLIQLSADDDIAITMRNRTLSLISVGFVSSPEGGRPSLVMSQGLKFALKWVNIMGFLFSSACVVVGLTVPDAKNMIGLGVAFLMLFVALSIYRKP